MPRNRRDVDREIKLDEILDHAGEQLIDGGYEKLSVAAIARSLGVAQNSIYWYFPSRDALLLALAERAVANIGPLPDDTLPLAERAIWLLDRMEETTPLRNAVKVRSHASDDLRAFRSRFHSTLVEMVTGWLEPVVGHSDAPSTAEVVVAAGEGLLDADLPRESRDRLLRFSLDKLCR